MRELADDIEHWLADEPVVGLPGGPAGAAGPLAPPAPDLDLRRRRRPDRDHARRDRRRGRRRAGARREAEARTLAETNFPLASKAVEDYFTGVSEDTLLKEQDSVDIRRLRSELLKTALEYYREFLRQRSGDPELRRDLADAQFRVGQIMREIGDKPEEAIEAFNASITLWGELLADAPMTRMCASIWHRPTWPSASSSPGSGDSPALRRAGPVARHPVETAWREGGRRVLPVQPGRLRPRAGHRRGRGGRARPGTRPPEGGRIPPEGAGFGIARRGRVSQRLADTINGLGYIHSRKGQTAEAIAAVREFQDICQGLLDDDRSGRRTRSSSTRWHSAIQHGGHPFQAGAGQGARRLREGPVEYRSALVERTPR